MTYQGLLEISVLEGNSCVCTANQGMNGQWHYAMLSDQGGYH